jgi:hypothetical protein
MLQRYFRSAAALLFLASGLLLSGCGTDSPTAPVVAVTGDYTLRTVAGEQVPLVLYRDAEVEIELLSGSVSFEADGTFVERLTFREVRANAAEPEIVELETEGTYTVAGNTVRFFSADAGEWAGTASGGVITYVVFDMLFTFGS